MRLELLGQFVSPFFVPKIHVHGIFLNFCCELVKEEESRTFFEFYSLLHVEPLTEKEGEKPALL